MTAGTLNPWIWEYSTTDGATVYDVTEYWDLESLKKAVDASFADYTWEEVDRRGMYGTSVLVKRNGRYVDTGHWVYRKQHVADQHSAATSTTGPNGAP